MRYILAALVVFSLYASAFAQEDNGTAQVTEQIVTVVPNEAKPTAAATLESTPAAPVCEDGATCNFNNTGSGIPASAVDPLTGFLLMATGSLITLLGMGLTAYVAGARILRGLMGSMLFMAFIESVYSQAKKRTPEALQKEAANATKTYEEFRDRVTDGIPDALRPVAPVEPPLMPPPVKTLPPMPPTE